MIASSPRDENNWIDSAVESNLQGRLKTLLDEITSAIRLVSKDLLPANPNLQPLVKTLCEFYSFSRDYFAYFKDPQRLQRQHAVIEKIQREWLTLQPLVEQRRSPRLEPWLRVADAIITDCMQSMLLATSGETCLTLFERTYHMARFAYTRVPGLGIPLTSQQAPWEWLGGGHEIGHYYYRNHVQHFCEHLPQEVIASLSNTLFQATEGHSLCDTSAKIKLLGLWNTWMEELFADVYGVLILGPACVRSLMVWLHPRYPAEKLLTNDQDHALPLLRPLIQIAALAELERQTGEVGYETVALRKLWEDLCARMAPASKDVNYWYNQQVDGVAVRAILTTIPTVVSTVVSAIMETSGDTAQPLAQYYSVATHRQVQAAATTLAKGGADAATLKVPLTQALPVMWYVWEQVCTEGDAQADRLDALRHWALRLVGTETVVEERLPDSSLNDNSTESLDLDKPSESFKKWTKDLKTQIETSNAGQKPQISMREAIARRLLEEEFSTEEYSDGDIVDGRFKEEDHFIYEHHRHYHPV